MKKRHSIFSVLDFLAVIIIIASLVFGGWYINEFGTIQTEVLGGFMMSETNYMAAVAGLSVILSGTTTGVFLLAFSLVAGKHYQKLQDQ